MQNSKILRSKAPGHTPDSSLPKSVQAAQERQGWFHLGSIQPDVISAHVVIPLETSCLHVKQWLSTPSHCQCQQCPDLLVTILPYSHTTEAETSKRAPGLQHVGGQDPGDPDTGHFGAMTQGKV